MRKSTASPESETNLPISNKQEPKIILRREDGPRDVLALEGNDYVPPVPGTIRKYQPYKGNIGTEDCKNNGTQDVNPRSVNGPNLRYVSQPGPSQTWIRSQIPPSSPPNMIYSKWELLAKLRQAEYKSPFNGPYQRYPDILQCMGESTANDCEKGEGSQLNQQITFLPMPYREALSFRTIDDKNTQFKPEETSKVHYLEIEMALIVSRVATLPLEDPEDQISPNLLNRDFFGMETELLGPHGGNVLHPVTDVSSDHEQSIQDTERENQSEDSVVELLTSNEFDVGKQKKHTSDSASSSSLALSMTKQQAKKGNQPEGGSIQEILPQNASLGVGIVSKPRNRPYLLPFPFEVTQRQVQEARMVVNQPKNGITVQGFFPQNASHGAHGGVFMPRNRPYLLPFPFEGTRGQVEERNKWNQAKRGPRHGILPQKSFPGVDDIWKPENRPYLLPFPHKSSHGQEQKAKKGNHAKRGPHHGILPQKTFVGVGDAVGPKKGPVCENGVKTVERTLVFWSRRYEATVCVHCHMNPLNPYTHSNPRVHRLWCSHWLHNICRKFLPLNRRKQIICPLCSQYRRLH